MGSGMIIWMLLFWFALGALLHTYILYPWLLKLWSAGKQLPDLKCPDEDLPMVSVLMAAYNEEKVIRRKLESIFQSDYPAEKLELVVGSDGSTDATNAIMEEFIGRGHRIVFKNFGGRTGKSGIINQIYPLAKGTIFIPTDANIMFSPGMVRKLVDRLSDPTIGLVGANIVNTGMQSDGISFQEEAYIKRENIIKYREGLLWGYDDGGFWSMLCHSQGKFSPHTGQFPDGRFSHHIAGNSGWFEGNM
jgi:cellulose synthase/poly-beta-1,6-N-acetylglucosamine synthase-like glycosyltransferase